jgi:HEAT repeat protein
VGAASPPNRRTILCAIRGVFALSLFSAAIFASDAAKTRELLGQLTPGSPLAERARACQQLAIVGTSEAVPALAALLADAQLGHYAREALEAMALPESDAALRDALGALRGLHLVGVINSLGARADRAAVPALEKIAGGTDAPAAGAALHALARIGTREALHVVRGAIGKNPLAPEALLVAADRARARGDSAAAQKFFDDVRSARVPEPALLAATRGAILARGANGVPLLRETLRSPKPALRNVALQAMRELPGEAVTASLVREWERLPAEVQPPAFAALVDRGGAAVLALAEKRAAAGDAEALAALGRIGRASSVPLLLRALPAREVAQRSLALIPAREADDLIMAALPAANAALKLKLIAVLGDRGVATATPELLRLARDHDAETTRAALRALTATAQPAHLPDLIRLSAASGDDAQRTLADRAIYAATMKILEPERRVDPLLAALRTAQSPVERAALFRPLGAVVRAMGGSASALAGLKESLHDTDPAVRSAAIRCLADWPDASPALELLALARGDPVALAGAVRMAGNVAAGRDKTPLDALAVIAAANALVASDAERMMIVSALGNVRRAEALRLLEPYLEIDAVKTEAALAVVQVAPALLNGANATETRRVLEKIAASERDADVRARAAELLKTGAAPKKAGKKKQ